MDDAMNPWLQLSGPSTQWTQPYEQAGVDPWKLTRKDGYLWFNPWLEQEDVPLADKDDYVRAYKGPSNPQIEYWKKFLGPVSDEDKRKYMYGAQLSDRERARLLNFLRDNPDPD